MWTAVSDGAVLFCTSTEYYYGLNEVGALIWELLPVADGLDDLCERIAKRYPEAPPSRIRSDACELLTDLAAHRLVVYEA